ncbi:acyltransferase ChoActase/COT/CPT [Meredithblackwellia eburnea MCA 4105]
MSSSPSWASWRLSPPTATPVDSVTFRNQAALPRLPVPALSDTIEKLLKSASALGTKEELDALKKKAEQFSKPGGIGEVLQKRLEARREEPGVRNWIAEWWDTDAYMAYRDSVVINVSYYYGFNTLPQAPKGKESGKPDPAYVGATIATTALAFRRLVAKGLLEPELVGKGPGELCMESFKWAYNACRVPALPADYAVKTAEDDPSGQHIIVSRQGRFWKVPIFVDGREVGVDSLHKTFQHILSQDIGSSSTPHVGILTGVNRDLWTEARARLLSDASENTKTIDAIESSAFLIAFDEASPEPHKSNEGMCDFSKKLWTGEKEGGNRWWDKPLQWVIFANGESGFIGEHSCMDGTPTARMNDFLSKRLLSDAQVPGTGSDFTSSASTPSLLPFKVSSSVQTQIDKAQKEFDAHISEYEVHYETFTRYGKEGIKAMGVSPDAWTQMLFQIAYYKTHGQPCGTYEAAQVRKFQLGRTETIRIATPDSVAFVKAFVDPQVSDLKKKELFLAATKTHGVDAKSAADGQGIDRHLFGWRHLLKEGEQADLLKDALVARSSTWNMSTSQIYIRNSPSYGWGPVVQEGYGIPYMVHPESLQFTITCRKSMPGRTFLDNLTQAGDDLMNMMERLKK